MSLSFLGWFNKAESEKLAEAWFEDFSSRIAAGIGLDFNEIIKATEAGVKSKNPIAAVGAKPEQKAQPITQKIEIKAKQIAAKVVKPKYDPNEKLTVNFTAREFFVTSKERGGFARVWREFMALPESKKVTIWVNIKRRAKVLQQQRDYFKASIHITSAVRPPALNAEVGGVKDSTHGEGLATDYVIAGVSPRTVQAKAKSKESCPKWKGGLGSYATFTHQDDRPYEARWNG